jgi:hypothetical protein
VAASYAYGFFYNRLPQRPSPIIRMGENRMEVIADSVANTLYLQYGQTGQGTLDDGGGGGGGWYVGLFEILNSWLVCVNL